MRLRELEMRPLNLKIEIKLETKQIPKIIILYFGSDLIVNPYQKNMKMAEELNLPLRCTIIIARENEMEQG